MLSVDSGNMMSGVEEFSVGSEIEVFILFEEWNLFAS